MAANFTPMGTGVAAGREVSVRVLPHCASAGPFPAAEMPLGGFVSPFQRLVGALVGRAIAFRGLSASSSGPVSAFYGAVTGFVGCCQCLFVVLSVTFESLSVTDRGSKGDDRGRERR
jgi:hypothetical protein